MSSAAGNPSPGLTQRLGAYLRIARPDHWFKNIFMLPGVLLALYDAPYLLSAELILQLFLALAAVCLIASSYYVLNEVLDGKTDAQHPKKSQRPVPAGLINTPTAYGLFLLLAAIGLALSYSLGTSFFACALALWVMSLIYNVPPIRAKDRMVADVLVESVNNPLRLALGWYAVESETLIPASLLAAFWMLGAFLMTVKRFAEYRLIGDPVRAAAYRASFRGYTEERLLVAANFYAVAFGLFLGVFLIRYRLELLVTVPLIAGVIAGYVRLGLQEDSPTQYPERLYQQRGLMLYLALCVGVAVAALYIDMPWLHNLLEPNEILQDATLE